MCSGNLNTFGKTAFGYCWYRCKIPQILVRCTKSKIDPYDRSHKIDKRGSFYGKRFSWMKKENGKEFGWNMGIFLYLVSSSHGICSLISVWNNFPTIVISISALIINFTASLSLKKYPWMHCQSLGLFRPCHCVITFESTRDYIHNRLKQYRNIYYSHAISLKLNQKRKGQTPYNWITEKHM